MITTGSVQAPETLYWGIAATLAKKGYVVLTYDVQGQGRSDTFGEGPDLLEGVPSQQGEPFYDGTEDALDFFLSTPDEPYRPRPSCTSGTSHAAKQDRRVAAGLATANNPLWDMIDPHHIGIAGHSLGASAVSFVGQLDPRVDAIVAWDNLRPPGDSGNFPTPDCPSGSSDRTPPPITKPALGFSNDYGLTPTPYTTDPDPESHNAGLSAYRAAGVDSMQVNIRGGSHYEYSYIPNVDFDATLRGLDMAIWYTAAWFDKYLKQDSSADGRLLTTRWQEDARGAQIDPTGDGNLFSFYLDSGYDFVTRVGPAGDLRRHAQRLRLDGARRMRPRQLLLSRGGADAGRPGLLAAALRRARAQAVRVRARRQARARPPRRHRRGRRSARARRARPAARARRARLPAWGRRRRQAQRRPAGRPARRWSRRRSRQRP